MSGTRVRIATAVFALSLAALTGCHRSSGGPAAGGPGSIALLAVAFDANEGSIVNILVNRSGGSAGVASVDYATVDGTATGGEDYTAASGTLTWANGLSGNQTISIAITDDSAAEFIESFTVVLGNASTATLGANTAASVDVIDNDVGALSAYGVISAIGSATVNAIRYDTSSATVDVNGAPAADSDLKTGHVAAVTGDVDFGAGTGIANRVETSALVIGPVENIDATLSQLVVLGQTVLANADTEFDPSIDPVSYAGLSVGATAQISGFLDAAGDIVATRIEPDTTSTGVQLVGAVAGLDIVNMLFTVNRLTVDYGTAAVMNLPGGTLAEGLPVLIRGSLTGGILVATEIESARDVPVTPGERVHLHGIVTRFASASDFDLDGIAAAADASAVFIDGAIGDLDAGVEITVEGEVASGGDYIAVSRIEFGRLVASRTTQTFAFDNFTNVSVEGLANVRIVQNANFSVEVTVDSSITGDLQVMQTGDTVSLGVGSSDNTQILSAVITMPQLDLIEAGPQALANVILEGFDQTAMTIALDGVSRLVGDGLAIGNLTATVSGVSALFLGGTSPIGSAAIDISGVSQATLNMAVGSTITGSVATGQGSGFSILFYYGTSVNVNVTTDGVSDVIQLGATRT